MTAKLKKEAARILLAISTVQLSQSFTFAIYTVFLMERGLSIFEASLVNMVYHVTVPLLEVPTGAFADVWGRKNSFLVSNALWVVAMFVYGSAHSLAGFVTAELIAAVATTFASGCIDAHLWDTISYHAEAEGGYEDAEVEGFNRTVSGWAMVATRIFGAIGGLVGARVASINIAWPWYLGGFGFMAAFILSAILLKDLNGRKKISYREDLTRLIRVGATAIRKSWAIAPLRRLAVISFILRMASAPLFMYWSPHLSRLGKGISLLGWVWIAIELSILIGTLAAKRLSAKFGDWELMAIGFSAAAISAFASAISPSFWPVLGFFLVLEATMGIARYGQHLKTQSVISATGFGKAGAEDNLRASILSLGSMSGGVGGGLGLLLGGLIAEAYSIPIAWGFGALLFLLAALLSGRHQQ